MARRKAQSDVTPIGVDLGTSSLKMVQLRPGGEGRYTLQAMGSLDIPAPCQKSFDLRLRFLVGGIQELLESEPFEGKRCALSLPAEETFVHPVRVSKTDTCRIPQLLEEQLRDKLPYPVTQAVVRHVIAGDIPGQGQPTQETIAIAAPRARIDAYLKVARQAKLDPLVMNVEPCAIIDCFAPLFAGAMETVLFVDIGEATTQVVLSRGEQIYFARNLSLGGRQLVQTLAKGLKVSEDQAKEYRLSMLQGRPGAPSEAEVYGHLEGAVSSMAGELTQCLRYYESVFKGHPVERALFLGGQANDTTLCQTIARKMNLPAGVGDAFYRVSVPGEEPSDDNQTPKPRPNLAVAVGLCVGSGKAA